MQKFGRSKFTQIISAMDQNTFNKLLVNSKRNRTGSGAVTSGLLPGTAAKFVPAAGSRRIAPESGRGMSARVPIGQPVNDLYVPEGIAVEDTVTVVIDTVALGLTTAKQSIVLFDEAKFYQASNGLATPFPANSVYINSASRNLYPCWIAGLCSQAYLFSGIKVDVAPAAGAAATAAMQFQQKWTYYNINTRKNESHELPVSNYNDPANYDRNVYLVPLTDDKSRVDRHTALVLDVYHGMVLTLTFFNQAYVRD